MDSTKTLDYKVVNNEDYPELKNYSNAEIYNYFIGCGGLYLATKMAREMNLKKGDIVLDLGCGFGSASKYLASEYDVTVIAVDLWFSPDKMLKLDNSIELKGKVIPLNIDITKQIPFSNCYFDAIFCMNSFFIYGGDDNFLNDLLRILKKDGIFCIGSEGFNKEPNEIFTDSIPEEYNFNWTWDIWDMCYSKYHTVDWWKNKIQNTPLLNNIKSRELIDGRILWEDFIYKYDDYVSKEIIELGSVLPKDKFENQIKLGNEIDFYPTLYIITGTKK